MLSFSSIEKSIEAIKVGQIVIVMDDEDRENEGDFVCAAETVTDAQVNFMLQHGRGQVCMSVLPETQSGATGFSRTQRAKQTKERGA